MALPDALTSRLRSERAADFVYIVVGVYEGAAFLAEAGTGAGAIFYFSFFTDIADADYFLSTKDDLATESF